MLTQQRLPYYSLGYWLDKMQNGEVFTYNSYADLSKCLEKYFPMVFCNFPLPLALAAPAINPKTEQVGMCIVHGGSFFEALYRFYRSELFVCPDNFHWLCEYNQSLPRHLTWDTTPDRAREKIFYTGIYVTELLSSEEKYFTCAQIEKLSKIDFHF